MGFRPQQQMSSSHNHHHHRYHSHHRSGSNHHRRSGSRHSSLTKRSTREPPPERFLHPGMLKYHRQALSVDDPPPCLRPILSNSRQSVLGSHPTVNTSSPTHEVLRTIKRSDTAKQHVLARQRNIEKEDLSHQHQHQHTAAVHSPHSPIGGGRRSVEGCFFNHKRFFFIHLPLPCDDFNFRRSSTASDASLVQQSMRRASTVSRTPSVDSRNVYAEGVGTEAEGAHSTGIDVHGVAGLSSTSPKSWRVSAQTSTPSVDKEFR